MRKKIRNIVLLSVIVSAFCGCEDFLNTRLDVYDTIDRLETRYSTLSNFANAYYSPMQYGFTTIDGNFFAAASDEAVQTSPVSDVSYFNKGLISPDANPLSYLYENYYEGIRAAHFFLDYAKNGEDFLALNRDTATVYNPDGTIYSTDNLRAYKRDVINLNWQRAEARIAEAFYYSELIKMYGGVPIVTNGEDNGGFLRQATYDEVVEHIVALIDENKNSVNLDWRVQLDENANNKEADVANWNFRNNTGRFDRTSALAVKARTLLYAASPRNNPEQDKKKWERAAEAAYEVISTRRYIFEKGFGFGGAKTYPSPAMPADRDYSAYFQGNTPAGDVESIFLIRKEAGSTPERLNYPIGTRGGNSGITPSHNLVESYEYIGPQTANPYDNRDPRMAATVVYNGSAWNGVQDLDQSPFGAYDMTVKGATKTGYYLKKFLAPNLNLIEGGSSDHVWPVFRYAEVLLNYAEAMNEAYGPDSDPKGYGMTARQALTEVRNSASTRLPAITASSTEDFRNAVKHERRVELAFEDHRYWDLVRWLDAEDVLNRPVKGVIVRRNSIGGYAYSFVNVEKRVFHRRNYYLPFTRNEVTNSNGTLTQNPEYN